MTELKIIEAENGFILTLEQFTDDGEKVVAHSLVEDHDGLDDGKDCMKRLLYKVADYFGCAYDKWDSKNLNITFDKKGHKVEDD